MKRADFKFQISQWRARREAIVAPVVCSVLLTLMSLTSFGAQKSPAKPPPDGTILTSVDGKLIADTGGAWLFELVADANSVSGVVTTGTRFELLPCIRLELLIADVNDRYAPVYRLAARVTRFRGKSFLFPTYYLPLSKLKDAKSAGVQSEGAPSLRTPGQGGESEPDLTIPPEVAEKLKSRRAVRAPQKESGRPAGGSESRRSPDHMLVDVLGRIEPAASGLQLPASDRFVFIPDAFGWDVSRTRYELLPCATLEQALQRRAESPEPIRFSVAGLVTEFKGREYLLLQRVIRAYGQGNFVR